MSPLRKIYDTFSSSSSDESSNEDSADHHSHHHHHLFDFLVGPGSSYGGIYIVPNMSRKVSVH